MSTPNESTPVHQYGGGGPSKSDESTLKPGTPLFFKAGVDPPNKVNPTFMGELSKWVLSERLPVQLTNLGKRTPKDGRTRDMATPNPYVHKPGIRRPKKGKKPERPLWDHLTNMLAKANKLARERSTGSLVGFKGKGTKRKGSFCGPRP